MAYKQNNNPFNRKISSPLRHSVVNSEGKSWKHSHRNSGVSGSFEGGKIIRGSEDFNKRKNRAVVDSDTDTRKMESGKRATSKNYAKDYADQLARGYNMGAITGGQFLAEEYNPGKGKFELFKGGDLIDFSTRGANIGEGGMYNVTYGERDNFVAPETQVTSDEIYEMMVQGGGLVSIVDGKIVAGNPNDVRFSERGTTGSEKSTFANQHHSGLANDYVPEGYTIDERSNERSNEPKKKYTVKELLERRKNQKPTVVDATEIVNYPNRKLTVKELIERRKQKFEKSNSAINRVMGNSPLNTGHEEMTDDERGGYNTQGDPRVNTITKIVYDEKGRPIGERDTITTEQDYIRQKEIPGTETPGDTGPNFKEDCEGIVMNVGNVSKSGKFKCDLNPNPPINTPGETVDPEVKEDMYTDSNVEEVYRPYEPDPVPDPVPDPEPVFEFDLGSGRKKKKQFDLELPEVNLPSLGLDELNILKKKCGGCRQRGLIQRAILALGGGI